MKRWLLFIVALISLVSNQLFAQSDTLFTAPDTVCINQPVTLTSKIFNQETYYWGFCSGDLNNTPAGTNRGAGYGLKVPGNIDIAYDSGYYYGFVVNAETTEFLCYFFGTSLNNTPTITNLGNVLGGLPVNPTSLFILHDTLSRHWYVYVAGGYTNATSSLGRLDFGPHLYNTHPNIVNFGNYNLALNYPKGVFVAQDANNQWYGYVVNHNNNHLIQLDFSYNASNTPLMVDMGVPQDTLGNDLLNEPTDLAAIYNTGAWYFFVTNFGSSTVARLDIGANLYPTVVNGVNMGNFDFRIDSPSSISLNLDCGELHAYVTDSTTSQLIGITMSTPTGPYYAVDYSILGGMNYPSCISSILRDSDNLYGYITNVFDSTLTQIKFVQCTNSSVPSFTQVNPPQYTYSTPGTYNVYFIVNQGLPTMQVACREITVLGYPPINMNTDTTICIGDTVKLYAVSVQADSIWWLSSYNIDTTYLYKDSVRVWPGYSYTYPVTLYYPFGCIVDTSVTINVSQVRADAGPDRWILDGATTTLGGQYSSVGNYTYAWSPFEYMIDSTVAYAVVNPPADFTYVLTVTETNDKFACQAMDTVTVHVDCSSFNVPNAFIPNSGNALTETFGPLNNQIISLDYFRVFDRWGVQVFEATNYDDKWDGTFNGKPCEAGVYTWVADGFCQNNHGELKKSGNVMLIR